MFRGRVSRGFPAALVAVLVGVGIVGFAQAAVAAPAGRLDPAAVDRFVEKYRATVGMPGVVVAITHGTEVVHVKGYGRDSTGTPMTARTPMRLASVSKSFTALAVMQLVEAGRVELDRPVREYLPELRMADPRVDAITVRQLLNQSSGLTQAAFPTADLPVVGSLREAVAQLAQARLGADPGKEWSYHNVNYRVAARLVEVISGERFDNYLRDRIFTPLGMDHTVATTTTRDRAPGLAEGYTVVYGVPVSRPELAEFAAGDGGIVSTAQDMTGWLISQLNGGTGPGGARVLSPAGVAELHRPSAPGGEYGLGWFSEDLPGGGRKVYHGGTAWTFTSQQVLLPDSGYGIVVLSNSRPAYVDDMQGITDGLVTMVEGGKPTGAQRYRLISEAVVVALTLTTLGGYTVLVLRAQRWARRRRQRHTRTVPLRLLPYVVTGTATAAFPLLMTRIGWDVNWSQLYFVAPSFAIWLTSLAVGAAVVTLVRLVRLIRSAGTAGAVVAAPPSVDEPTAAAMTRPAQPR